MTETVTLFSTGCPKCGVLKKKLEAKNIPYTENTNVQEMLALGIRSAPNLMVGDEILDFTHAITWINNQ